MQNLKEMLGLAEEFAKMAWPYRKNLGIEDIVLYGSVARGSEKPNDVDIIVLHSGNRVMQQYGEQIEKRKDIEVAVKCKQLCTELVKAGHQIPDLLSNGLILQGILENKLNICFLDTRFFRDIDYTNLMMALNDDPNFYGKVFSYALLFNTETEKFDIPARSKYIVPRQEAIEKAKVTRVALEQTPA